MEKFYVNTLLFSEKIISEDTYTRALFEMTALYPEFGDLEQYTDVGEVLNALRTRFDFTYFNRTTFGTHLVRHLREPYETLPLADFCNLLFDLFLKIPISVRMEEPFLHMMSAAQISDWGDEARARELCEAFFAAFK